MIGIRVPADGGISGLSAKLCHIVKLYSSDRQRCELVNRVVNSSLLSGCLRKGCDKHMLVGKHFPIFSMTISPALQSGAPRYRFINLVHIRHKTPVKSQDSLS